MTIDFKMKKIWAPDPQHGFVLGSLVDIGTESATVELPNGKKIVAPYDSVFPAEENDKKDVDDNCALMYLNEATLLSNVRLRYAKDQIYTYVANILISVNPYFDVAGLYSSATIKKYQGKSLGVLPPHIFAIADKAYRDMKRVRESQSIIVSGESGAGKTESQKYVLRYLCENWGSHAGPIEQRILETNPILEAFGNAKTIRNNNSSRFGKFVEIHFGSKFTVAGGHVSHYLLEKSRICSQQREERNYHIFYQLCAGAPKELQQQLRLMTPDQYKYLSSGCTQYFLSVQSEKELDKSRCSKMALQRGPLKDPIIDDVGDFRKLDSSLANVGLDKSGRFQVYATVAAVLHLGNVDFTVDPEDTRGGCCVSADSESSLVMAAGLLGVDKDELHIGLTSRVMQTAKGGNLGTIIRVPLKVGEAQHARDALAKAIYSRLFDYIVDMINNCIPFSSSDCYIGVLDIAGFEYFGINSFEQFCINYCNEKLQQFFNDRILKQEQELYDKEGLGVKKIDYVDNQDCIDLIEARGNGIFDLLDEESKLPRPNAQHFTSATHQTHKNHFRLAVPRKSKLREHRDVRDDEGLLIRHFAGAVCYHTVQFIDKNNDALHASLEYLIQDSKSPLLKRLFQPPEEEQNGNSLLARENPRNKQQGKLGFISVGSKFRSQLKVLMEKLDSTGTHFVRCIKPNLKMKDHVFEGGQILSQLQCSGMTSVLELMQQGFPSRTLFADLYNMYKSSMPPDLARLDPRLFSRCLFKALGLNDQDFKFGLTKVFFRPGKFAEFDQMMRADPENLAILVKKVKKWLIRTRWKKSQWCALSVIKLKNKIIWRREQLVKIQSHIRGWLTQRKYKPKIKGVKKVRAQMKQIEEMRKISMTLQTNQAEWTNKIKALSDTMTQLITKIRDSPMSPVQIDTAVNNITNDLERTLVDLRKQAGEQERLRRLQEEMESARKMKEAEETKKRQFEEEKKMKAEMELKRKQEEEKHRRENEINSRLAEEQKKQNLVEEKKRQQFIEQERRDHELALRLAQESNGIVEDMVIPTKSFAPANVSKKQSKYDLSKWTHAALRDVINTSTDMEMLEACRDEFHRRLKAYQEWKAKNKSQVAEDPRLPDEIAKNEAFFRQNKPQVGSVPQPSKSSGGGRIQRYFRIPFVRPADRYRDAHHPQSPGHWYGHFDGEWIARQMELHPDKVPVLLIAGRDDMQMCELSLDETGLARKRGAEIIAHEFESEWVRHGGPLYNPLLNRHVKNGPITTPNRP